jgi:hypothetical protein
MSWLEVRGDAIASDVTDEVEVGDELYSGQLNSDGDLRIFGRPPTNRVRKAS